MNQATPLGGAPPFFPPGVLPLPGTFPSLPLIDNSAMHIPPKEGQTSQTGALTTRNPSVSQQQLSFIFNRN